MAATHGSIPGCPAGKSSAAEAAASQPQTGAGAPALSEAAQRFLAEVAALAEETARQASAHELCAAGHAREACRCSELGEWHELEAQRLYRAAATCRSKAQTAQTMSTAGKETDAR